MRNILFCMIAYTFANGAIACDVKADLDSWIEIIQQHDDAVLDSYKAKLIACTDADSLEPLAEHDRLAGLLSKSFNSIPENERLYAAKFLYITFETLGVAGFKNSLHNLAMLHNSNTDVAKYIEQDYGAFNFG